MPPKLTRTDDALEVSLSGLKGSEFNDAKEKIKAIPGRKFDGEKKVWQLPRSPAIAERVLHSLQADTAPDIVDWIKSERIKLDSEVVSPIPDDAELALPWSDKLFGFQRGVIDRMADTGNGVNACDMGLGKSVMALATVVEFYLRHDNGKTDSAGPRAREGTAPPKQGENSGAVTAPRAEGQEARLQEGLERKEPELPQGVSSEEHRADSGEQQSLSAEAPGSVESTNSDGEGQAVRGLRDSASARLHGPGSCEGGEAVYNRPLSVGESTNGVHAGRTAESRNSEVRSALSELSPLKTLPKLIVCPNSVMGSWADEIDTWLHEKAVILDGDAYTRAKLLRKAEKEGSWVVTNWEKIRVQKVKEKTKKTGRIKEVEVMKEPLFESIKWAAVIADEAHRAKNRKALTTKGLWRINAPIKLALTGTPIMNSPDELWAILKWLYPKEYTSYWRFYNDYVDFYEGYFGKVITGVRNPDALRFELKDKIVRRTKDEALDLPPKIRRYVKLDLSPKQRKLYNEAEKEMWIEVEQAAAEGDPAAKRFIETAVTAPARIYDLPNGAARTVRLRQVASTPALLGGEDVSVKLDTAVELIEDAGEKQIVVFSEFKPTCSLLKERLAKKKIVAETLTGDDDPDVRSDLVRRFQAGEIQVLCCTIAAGGVGLTLTAADTCIFLDRHWTPAINEQAEDRLHRIGQDSKVTVIILQAKNTVDTGKIHPTNKLKESIVGSVIAKDKVEVVD